MNRFYPFVIEVVHYAHTDCQLAETHAPYSHFGAFLRKRIHATGRNYHHTVVHRGLEDVYQGNAAVNNFHGLAKLQRRGLALVLSQPAHRGLGGGRMLDPHIHPCILVETLSLGHIVTCELCLCSPLGSEDNGAFLRRRRYRP